MGTEYKPAPEIQEIAEALIADHHTHLKEAVIEYLWREGAWYSKGRPVLGSTTLVSGLEKYYLDGANFRILINANAWMTMDPAQRRAVVDHYLYRCEKDGDGERDGQPKWITVDPDIQEFTGVVDHHGLYTNDLRTFAKVAMEKGGFVQSTFPTTAAAVEAAVAAGDGTESPGSGPKWEYEGPDKGRQDESGAGDDEQDQGELVQ